MGIRGEGVSWLVCFSADLLKVFVELDSTLVIGDNRVYVLNKTWCGLQVWSQRVESAEEGWIDLLTTTWAKGDSRALGAQHAASLQLIHVVFCLTGLIGEVVVNIHYVVPDDDLI